MAAATTETLSLLLVLLSLHPSPSFSSASPYLFPSTLFQDMQSMLTTFKIFTYAPSQPFTFSNPSASLFYNSLLNCSFLTHDPHEAHLFFVPFSPDTSPRALARVVRDLRTSQPYWNRTLGADHFFISPSGIDYSSDRNVLELKKNAVQVSVFPVSSGNFVPHKDMTLPPLKKILPHAPPEEAFQAKTFLGSVKYSMVNTRAPPVNFPAKEFLAFLKWDGVVEPEMVNELKQDVDFIVDSGPLDDLDDEGIEKSKFCLLFHGGGGGGAWNMVEGMTRGCVPVVIVERPVQDLPLMDVLKWSEMVLVVAARGRAQRLKEVLNGVTAEKYERMQGLGAVACKHLVWNAEPQPLDAFHMVMYQLWRRRHTIRYARRSEAE